MLIAQHRAELSLRKLRAQPAEDDSDEYQLTQVGKEPQLGNDKKDSISTHKHIRYLLHVAIISKSNGNNSYV